MSSSTLETNPAKESRQGSSESPSQTVRIRNPIASPPLDTTDYELSASTIMPPSKSSIALPPIRFVEPNLENEPEEPKPSTSNLDAFTRRIFHQRLRLCCLIAVVPFVFFFACALTNFIEQFGRETVGMTGAILAAAVIAGLIATAVVLVRSEPYDENVLRAVELGVFGSMALFFAYWQFVVLNAVPMKVPDDVIINEQMSFKDKALEAYVKKQQDMRRNQEQVLVFTVTLITHLNWVALIVFHGVLVPNSLIRGASVVGGMAALAILIDFVAVGSNTYLRGYTFILFLIAIPTLAGAAALAIFGTAKTAALREEVEEARQMIRELGQYRLRRRLGSGGMGEVYLAEHHLLKRPCAIKRIHPKYLDHPDQIRRFEREVQATARLRHPNTVEIYDYGRADDGTFYYVMEYLAGQSLEDMIGRFGPMSPDRVIHVLRQVCGALREAHRHELIHRDIKPSNIILLHGSTPHDVAKLVDFGLVHSTNWAGDPESKLTRDGLIVGTPEYMSPEQAQGLALDVRSDLFSLGSVAYYLLTAKEPFHRETAMKTLLAVVSDTPPPIIDSNPFVPDDLCKAVMRCLAKEPSHRFQSAQELEAVLNQCRGQADWTEKKAAEWWDTHPGSDLGTGTDLDSLPIRSQGKHDKGDRASRG
ncbi:MAG: serine/threonine-protein kinase [Gemmataceae bacterium]